MDRMDRIKQKTLAVPDDGDDSFHHIPILLYERGVFYTCYVSFADFEVSVKPTPDPNQV